MKERIPALVAATVLAVTGLAGLVDGLRDTPPDDAVDVPAGPAATCTPEPATGAGG